MDNSYTGAGYNEFLARVPENTAQGQLQEIDSNAFEQFTPDISGAKIQNGVIKSNTGKLLLDLDNDTFIVTDGVAERARLGNLPDGKIGLLIKDSLGNILMQISEGKNIIQSFDQTLQINFDEAQFLVNDNGTPIILIGKQIGGF